MSGDSPQDRRYRQLPKVDALLRAPQLCDLPHAVVVGAARTVLDELRAGIASGSLQGLPDVEALVLERARLVLHGRLRPVLNATGICVHTNLGRAPWAPVAQAAAVRAMEWCNVELELPSGKRGGRLDALVAQVHHLTGAEDALVVNNNAAAVLLALTALARGREVVVSRGELVEIGGSFRVPDVIASGGARMIEVGTTNRTRAGDFAAAIGPDTALLLRVHPSNFRVVGFTGAASRAELVDLAHARGLLVVEDLGSGSIEGLQDEPSVREVVASGVDLVCFSGDKLLGGPQAGIVAGTSATVARLRAHPLYRALRVDKVVLAALEATLGQHARGDPPPVVAMLTASLDELEARAHALASLLEERGVAGVVGPADGFAGGGALPARPLESRVVRLAHPALADAARALRLGTPAVLARVADDRLVLDVRTLPDSALPQVADRVARVWRSEYPVGDCARDR